MVSDEICVCVVTVPFGMSASVPGVLLVLASNAVNPVKDEPAIPTYAVRTIGLGSCPVIITTESVVIVMIAIIARVETTMVMIRFEVAGIVKFNSER